jgi:uncharacterized protein (TIGR02145 family)
MIVVLCAVAMVAMYCVQFEFNNPVDPANGGSGNACVGGRFVDTRDGQGYRCVTIDTQTWMAEKLNFNASGSVCYNNEPSNCNTYGRLYDWATVMGFASTCDSTHCASQVQSRHQGICPVGWRVPSEADWTTLTTFVGSNAGTKLKSRTGWNGGGNGTDDFGFSALPGGYGWGGSFNDVGNYGDWWSATENGADYAWRWLMDWDYSDMSSRYHDKAIQFSLRCITD